MEFDPSLRIFTEQEVQTILDEVHKGIVLESRLVKQSTRANVYFVETKQGEFYIADGYGAQHIMHYDEKGNLKNVFGGRGEGEAHFDNAHGICVDKRNSTTTLLITDRTRNAFKRFSLMSKVWCFSHSCHACLDTVSNTSCPLTPGNGANSSPSMSF